MANVTIKTPSGGTISMPEEALKRYQESQGGFQGVAAPSRPISTGGDRPMPTGEFGMSGAEMQAARLDQVRQNALIQNQERTRWVTDTIASRRENQETYTTPSGGMITAPTNRFGQPIASWQNIYEKSSAANEAALASIRRTSQPQPASTISLPSFGSESSQLARNLGEAGGFGLPSTFYSPQRQAPQSTAPPLGAGGGGFVGVTSPWSGSITAPTQYPTRRSQGRQQAGAISQPLNFPRPIGSDVENQYRPRFGSVGML